MNHFRIVARKVANSVSVFVTGLLIRVEEIAGVGLSSLR